MKGGRRENAGRKPGVGNHLAQKQKEAFYQKHPDFNPLEELYQLYLTTDKDDLKAKILEVMLKKTVPDLKAVEHSVSEGTTLLAPVIAAPGATIVTEAMGGMGIPDGQ